VTRRRARPSTGFQRGRALREPGRFAFPAEHISHAAPSEAATMREPPRISGRLAGSDARRAQERVAQRLQACPGSALLLSAPPVPATGDSARRPPEPPAFTKQIFATAREIPAPVSFSLGERGEVFTVNSARFDGHGVFDNRRFPIVLDDATSTSVADRRRLT